MKINEISNNMNQIGNLETSGAKQKEAGAANTQAAEKEIRDGAKVELSNTSVEFSKAAEKMDAVPPERLEKIEQLKMMVQNDTYNVDANKIAEKVVEESITDIV